MEIYKNEHFFLDNVNNELFITVTRPGFDLRSFNSIVLDTPAISLSNFNNLKTALSEAKSEPVYIGILKPRVEVIISSNELEAKIKLNISAKEMVENKIQVSTEIIEALHAHGITEGMEDIFKKPLVVQKEILIANGIPPTDGVDAQITYYEPTEKKPLVKEDGSVNHYELNLIDNVKKGDWLGEKVPPTEGQPGKTVNGKIINPRRGKDKSLKYDKKTIEENEENGKIVLRALIDGAVKFESGKIKIDNHLIIPGDVDFKTGNINFEGYVTVRGTVQDGFSVIAKNDIEIQGQMGIGAISLIKSKEGSIYIKGGSYGRGVAVIEAAKSIFIKYCNECTITAGDDINIGFYALDSVLTAKTISLDPTNGKIIGGIINAEVQVVAGIIGNKAEKKTQINVHGFDRLAVKTEFEGLLVKYKKLLEEANKIRRQIEIYENSLAGAEYANMDELKTYMKKYDNVVDEIKILDEYRIRLQKILQTEGEGAVGISKAAYPETYLEIKNLQKKINQVVKGTFYVTGRELHHK